MMRTYWLSFADADRPRGQQFLGVVIVDVTDQAAAAALAAKPDMYDKEEGPWIAAAIRAAWAAGVNPGGEVGSMRIDEGPPEIVSRYPRLMLLSRADVDRFEPQSTTEPDGAGR